MGKKPRVSYLHTEQRERCTPRMHVALHISCFSETGSVGLFGNLVFGYRGENCAKIYGRTYATNSKQYPSAGGFKKEKKKKESKQYKLTTLWDLGDEISRRVVPGIRRR